MKYLLIGDMHVKRDNLDESLRVIKWIAALCEEHNAIPIFLGDQYNDFGIARVEVSEFWYNAYRLVPGSISLVGNHDQNPDASASAMSVHQGHTKLIGDEPQCISIVSGVWGVGFIRDNNKFIEACRKVVQAGGKTLLCHAEVNGAQYENGFYAPHGIDLKQVPDSLRLISGHIHKSQTITVGANERVVYIGTPRMLTRSDIGEVKGVVLTDFALFQFFPTPKEVAEPFSYAEVVEGQPLPEVTNSERCFIDIKGSQDFIKATLPKIPEGVKVRCLPENQKQEVHVKESDGIPKAFSAFARMYATQNNLSQDELSQILTSLYQRCPILKEA